MARKPSTSIDGPTLLGQFIESHLRKTKLTGDAFQDQMHQAHPAYRPVPTKISKYVTQGRPVPTLDFLSAVAAVLGISAADAADLAARPAENPVEVMGIGSVKPPAREQFTLLMGHTTWGAAVTLAAMEGRLPQFQVSTYHDKQGNPVFIQRDTLQKPAVNAKTQTDAGRAAVPGPHNRDKSLQCYSAPTVLSALVESKDVDAIVIPRLLAEANAGTVKAIARIALTAVGCQIVCGKDLADILVHKSLKRTSPLKTESTDSYYAEVGVEWIVHTLHPSIDEAKLKNRKVAIEQNSISDRILQLGCGVHFPGVGKSQSNAIAFNCSTKDLEKGFNFSAKNQEETSSSQNSKKSSNQEVLAGVITWEPFATWIRQSDTKFTSFGVRSPVMSEMPYVELELCMRASDWESNEERPVRLRRALLNLVDELNGDRDKFNLASSIPQSQKGLEDHQLAMLSNYYDMAKEWPVNEPQPSWDSLQNILAALSTINFESTPYRDFRKRCEQE